MQDEIRKTDSPQTYKKTPYKKEGTNSSWRGKLLFAIRDCNEGCCIWSFSYKSLVLTVQNAILSLDGNIEGTFVQQQQLW